MKRKYAKCVNPLFEQWLEEWKKIAIEQDNPTQFSYAKAITSLRRYPLVLYSGRECMILEYFGPKLCSMLDKKLKQYREENPNVYLPTRADSVRALNDEAGGKKRKKQGKKKTDQNDDLNQTNNAVKAPRKPVHRAKVPYIPKAGSAAFAILVTMYKNLQEPDNPGFMFKKDIISQAQGDCECQMKGTALQHYGGWASMSTLIEKHFVTKKNSPAKYRLTDAGIALAMSLYEGKSAAHPASDDDDPDAAAAAELERFSQLASTMSSVITPPKYESSGTKNSGSKSSGSKSSQSQASSSKTSVGNEDIVEIDKDYYYDDNVFTQDEQDLDLQMINERIERMERMEKDKAKQLETILGYSSDSEDFDKFCQENPEPVITVRRDQPHFIFAKTVDSYSPPRSLNEKNDELELQKSADYMKPGCSTTQKKTEETKQVNGKPPKATQQKKNSVEETPYEPFFLLANNFDIILLVDHQETSGGKTKPKDDATISELSKCGVLHEVRSLKVGDFLWIARCRFTNKELVLPYIIERKRMDDLGSSIKDGRYHEQKFRLKQSGIPNIIYMVESYGKNLHTCIPLTSLMQAAVNSAVQDNFTVKYTKDHKDSMRYLSTMTTMLTSNYEGKELWSCSKKDLQPDRLMEFNEFNKASVKTKNYNVKQMLIRQLLQLKGVGVDKAVAITELYPTPKILADALKQSDEKMLANIETGPSKRKLGPTISKTFYQLYTRQILV